MADGCGMEMDLMLRLADLMLRLAQGFIEHLVDTSQSVVLQCSIFHLALKP